MFMPIGPLYFKEEIIGLFFKSFKARNSRVELAPPPHQFRTFSSVFLIGSHQDCVQRDRCFVSFFFPPNQGHVFAWGEGLISEKC